MTFNFLAMAGISGLVGRLRAVALSSSAANHVFVASDAHDAVFP